MSKSDDAPRDIDHSPPRKTGRRLATIAAVVGILGTVIAILTGSLDVYDRLWPGQTAPTPPAAQSPGSAPGEDTGGAVEPNRFQARLYATDTADMRPGPKFLVNLAYQAVFYADWQVFAEGALQKTCGIDWELYSEGVELPTKTGSGSCDDAQRFDLDPGSYRLGGTAYVGNTEVAMDPVSFKVEPQ